MTEQELLHELRILREKLHRLYQDVTNTGEEIDRVTDEIDAIAHEIHKLQGGEE